MKNILFVTCMLALFASCMQPANNANADLATKNKAVVQRFYDEVFNKHNVAMVDSLTSADFVDHNPDPGFSSSRDDVKKSLAGFFAGFPDLNVKTNFVVVDSDKVVTHFTITGTNSGPMMGMPATNKKMNVDGIDIVKVKDGKAVERWGYVDQMKMMVQMGLMPDPTAKPDAGTTTTTTVETKETSKEVTKDKK